MISLKVNEPKPNVTASEALIDPAEISAIEPRANLKNFFGPPKPHVVIHLRSGASITVYDTMDEINAKLAAAKGA